MWDRFKTIIWNWQGVIGTVSYITVIVSSLRVAGWLQPIEWSALDFMFQMRSQPAEDSRIIIISIEEKDIQRLKQWPVSDRILAELLQKVKQQQPRAIGLSLYRDLPVFPGHQELVKVFKSTPNLIGITKAVEDPFFAKVNPPSDLTEGAQISASDLIVDGDGVVRRAFLYPVVTEQETIPSLGMAVAIKYLEAEQIFPSISAKNNFLQLKNTLFPPFQHNDGSYVGADDGGYQTILNFKGFRSNFLTVSFTDVLAENFASELFRDRIVLIGSQASSTKNHFYTPYSRGKITNPIQISGVEIQAHLASQILSTVLDGSAQIKVWSDPAEYFWIFSCGTVVAIFAWKYRQTKNALKLVGIIVAIEIISIITLVAISYCAFLAGWWLPLVPALMSSFGTAVLILAYINVSKLQEYNTMLRAEVKARTRKLETALTELHSAQSKIIFQEKLAALGTLVAGVSHELKNPLHFIVNFADLSVELLEELESEIKQGHLPLAKSEKIETIQDNIATLNENLVEIQAYSKRANEILQTMLPHPHQQSFDYLPSDIHHLIDSAINLVFHSQKKYDYNFNIQVIKDYDQTINLVKTIPQNLSSALINIINNAYYTLQKKYLDNKHDFTPTLTIKTKNSPDNIEITIQDNGQGIPQELVNQVFDPFFTTKPAQEGTGLGLSISYDLITKNSQGQIKLETKVSLFTRLIISLPKNPVIVEQTFIG